MSDEPKPSEPRKPEPQVIDLEPGEVRDETPPGPEPEQPVPDDPAGMDRSEELPGDEGAQVQPPPPSAPPGKRKGAALWIAAALVAGLAAGGWLYRDVLSAYWPTSQTVALSDRLDILEAAARTRDEQIAAVNQKADEAARGAAAAGDEARASTSALSGLAARLDETDGKMAAAAEALAAARSDLDSLRAAISAGGSNGGGAGTIDTAALAALGQRIDTLEKDMASLKAGAGDRSSLTAGLSQALADLKAKIAAGTGFAAEYDRIARMVPAAPGLDVLAAHAAEGLPGAAGLASELTAAIPALPQPEAPAPVDDGSYWDSFTGLISGIITIREIGEADWPELARKAAGLAETGDLAQAIAVIEQAEGVKPQALNTWRDRAEARIRLEAALNQVAEAVVRQIAALGANP